MHSFIEGSIPDKFQNDQMIRYGAESLAKRFFVILHYSCVKFDKQMETYENMWNNEKEKIERKNR